MEFFFTTPNSTKTPNIEYRFRVLPNNHSEKKAKGTDRGNDSRIVSGCTRLSNCEARIIYMKITDNKKAQMNSTKVRSNSRPRPDTVVVYVEGMFISTVAVRRASRRSARA